MSSWVKEALSEAGISYRAFAEYLRPVYPKASASAIAAACNSADTGVTFMDSFSVPSRSAATASAALILPSLIYQRRA